MNQANYTAIARAIRNSKYNDDDPISDYDVGHERGRRATAGNIANYLAVSSSKFNLTRFLKACDLR